MGWRRMRLSIAFLRRTWMGWVLRRSALMAVLVRVIAGVVVGVRNLWGWEGEWALSGDGGELWCFVFGYVVREGFVRFSSIISPFGWYLPHGSLGRKSTVSISKRFEHPSSICLYNISITSRYSGSGSRTHLRSVSFRTKNRLQ